MRLLWAKLRHGALTERGLQVVEGGCLLPKVVRFRMWGIEFTRGFVGVVRRLPE